MTPWATPWRDRLLALCLVGLAASAASSPAHAQAVKPGRPGSKESLLAPFDPPSLAELDAGAHWTDSPVVDALELLRQRQAGEKPLATEAEALGLRNTSDAANAKITSALGRLPASDAAVDWNATINRHIRGDVRAMNPLLVSSIQENDIAGLTSFGIFSFDWEMRPFASSDAVRSWQTSADRLVDKVVLRDDLFWSDGRPITAHDVVFSFQTILDTRIPIPAVRSGTDQLKWVHAYDDKTLVYFHKAPLATNVWALNFPVIPKHVYEQSIDEDVKLTDSDYHARLEENPICGGAYRVSKRVRGQEIVLERRDDYYQVGGRQVRPKPYFKTIRFRIIEDVNTAMLALKKGDVDDLELTPEQWTTLTNDDGYYQRNTKAKGLEWVYFYFAWNMQGNPFFGDVRVRQAMSYAFDHREMLDKLCYGMFEPASGIWHPTSWMSPKKPAPPYRRDLDKAEALLAEAGWEDTDNDGILDRGVDGRRVPFEFSVVVSQNPMRIAICDLLKQNLDEIGIVCNVRPLESTVLQEQMFNKRFQAAFGGWGTGADPDRADNIWATGEGRNYVSYSNPEVDRLFQAGKREFDRDKRGAIYAQIHELIYADQPYTWLYFQSSFYGFNKELRGYNFSPRGPYHYGPGFGSVYRAADR